MMFSLPFSSSRIPERQAPSVSSSPLRQFHRILRRLLGLGVIPSILAAGPTLGAERIYFSYGPFERSIPIDSLETYARDGIVDDHLEHYVGFFTPEQLDGLNQLLLTRIELSPVALAQFLYTYEGEVLLERLGRLVQSQSRQHGFYALRGSLILSAADPDEGLTLLNVLRYFPTQAIRVDLNRSLKITEAVQRRILETNAAIALLEKQAQREADLYAGQAFSDLTEQLADPRQAGPFSWEKRPLELISLRRKRSVAEVYLPQGTPATAPLVVISHGLGGDLQSFAYLAEHLASYGFAVATLEHPGSNSERVEKFLSGRSDNVAEPEEFEDRPADITDLLDELSHLSDSDPSWRGRFNLNKVGVMGQSFGGYTALALAGGTLNAQALADNCSDLSTTLNLSILLQCRALALPIDQVMLQDDRVKAVVAVNPISSLVFGENGMADIDVPTMIVTGNADIVAPALAEQIRPFAWLMNDSRHLVLIRASTHFSAIADSEGGLPVAPEAIGPAPDLAKTYVQATNLAFFKTYLAEDDRYRPFLSAAYAATISQEPLPLSQVSQIDVEQLQQAIQNPDAIQAERSLAPDGGTSEAPTAEPEAPIR